MDTGNLSNLAAQGQHLADKAAEKMQSVRSSALPALGAAADRAGSALGATYDSLAETGNKVRSTVADAGDAVVKYTKTHPVKAILISAAAGALIATIVRALNRD